MIEIVFDTLKNKELYEGDALALGRAFYPGDRVAAFEFRDKAASDDEDKEQGTTVYMCSFSREKVSADPLFTKRI